MKANRPTPLLVGFEGTRLNSTLQEHLLKINPAGIVLFKRNIETLEQLQSLIREIRDLLGPIIVATDHEGGLVHRFPADCPSPPSPMALMRSGDDGLLKEAVRMQAELLQCLGINLNLAPVLDLATDLWNPAIGTRAVSNDPDDVIRYGKVCVDAHRSVAVGTTVKHFPGHGRSLTDSHHDQGEVTASLQTLQTLDLKPFRELIRYGIPALMPAHLSYPALDPGVPATFSQRIIGDLLRDELGFQGLVLSDCVEMAAVGADHTPQRIAQLSLAAGIDLLVSSFSLKRSADFQLSLASALRDAGRSNMLSNSGLEALDVRLDSFLQTYIAQPSRRSGLFSATESVIQLHRQTIEKRKNQLSDDANREYLLLEVTGSGREGINTGNEPGTLVREMMKRLEMIRQHRKLSTIADEAVNDIVSFAGMQHLTILLITADGHSLNHYDMLTKALKDASTVVHVSLMDDRDLTGQMSVEWVTWGYNSWTAKALIHDLLLL